VEDIQVYLNARGLLPGGGLHPDDAVGSDRSLDVPGQSRGLRSRSEYGDRLRFEHPARFLGYGGHGIQGRRIRVHRQSAAELAHLVQRLQNHGEPD